MRVKTKHPATASQVSGFFIKSDPECGTIALFETSKSLKVKIKGGGFDKFGN